MNKNRFSKPVAVAAGFFFLCAAPGLTRAQTSPPTPAPIPRKTLPAVRPKKDTRTTDDFAGLQYTDEQKARIDQIYLPLLALTRCKACLQFSSSQTSSMSRSVPARLSDLRLAIRVSVPCAAAVGASLLLSVGKASTSCSGRFFCRCPLMSRAAYLPFPLLPLRRTVRAFGHSRLGLSVAPPFGLGVPH